MALCFATTLPTESIQEQLKRAKTIGFVVPELKRKLHGIWLRVPTSTISIEDRVVELKQSATIENIVKP